MSVNFPAVEEDVLRLWKDIDAFQTQLRLTEGGPHFNFYDGPPFGMALLLQALITAAPVREWILANCGVVCSDGYSSFLSPAEEESDDLRKLQGDRIRAIFWRLPSKILYLDIGP